MRDPARAARSRTQDNATQIRTTRWVARTTTWASAANPSVDPRACAPAYPRRGRNRAAKIHAIQNATLSPCHPCRWRRAPYAPTPAIWDPTACHRAACLARARACPPPWTTPPRPWWRHPNHCGHRNQGQPWKILSLSLRACETYAQCPRGSDAVFARRSTQSRRHRAYPPRHTQAPLRRVNETAIRKSPPPHARH